MPVLPVRAKGVLYDGDTNWHTDSDLDVMSIGFLCYLESLQPATGALRVLPASHREPFGASVHARSDTFAPLPGVAIETDPGDAIVFDEHLCHSSVGGRNRRQWRVDYVADPTDADEEAAVRDYFARLFVPGWDGGYDVDRFPTYGSHWRASGRPWLGRLQQLGAHDAAAAEEAACPRSGGARALVSPLCRGPLGPRVLTMSGSQATPTSPRSNVWCTLTPSASRTGRPRRHRRPFRAWRRQRRHAPRARGRARRRCSSSTGRRFRRGATDRDGFVS